MSTKYDTTAAYDSKTQNYYDYEYDVNGNENPNTETDKNVTVREHECIPLSDCYFYTEQLDHPSLPREVVEIELKKQECGFDGVNNEPKGKELFEK